jgi:hypothetical protein|tara:strand:+ start:3511 stop:3618 length:108 start_codon:yes stop_codon:yes gene_type:complete
MAGNGFTRDHGIIDLFLNPFYAGERNRLLEGLVRW